MDRERKNLIADVLVRKVPGYDPRAVRERLGLPAVILSIDRQRAKKFIVLFVVAVLATTLHQVRHPA